MAGFAGTMRFTVVKSLPIVLNLEKISCMLQKMNSCKNLFGIF